MSFRLALVGHGSSIREIQEIVAETFENIETVGIEMPSDERVDEAAQALSAGAGRRPLHKKRAV